MIEDLLYRLTFLPQNKIIEALAAQYERPEENIAKKLLAKELLSYITGSSDRAESVSNYSRYFNLDFASLVAYRLMLERKTCRSTGS